MQLEPNDIVAVVSDGVTEALDPDENLFGVNRLREVLRGKSDLPLDEIQIALHESLESFARGASQADDLTILLARYRTVGL